MKKMEKKKKNFGLGTLEPLVLETTITNMKKKTSSQQIINGWITKEIDTCSTHKIKTKKLKAQESFNAQAWKFHIWNWISMCLVIQISKWDDYSFYL